METGEVNGCARCSSVFQKLEAFETYKSMCFKNQKVFTELIEEKKANAKLSKHYLLKSQKLEESRKLVSSLSASANELSAKCKKLERNIDVSRFELASAQRSKEDVLKELEAEKNAHAETCKEMEIRDARFQTSEAIVASKDFVINQCQVQIKSYEEDSEKYKALKKEHRALLSTLLGFIRGKAVSKDLFRRFRKFVTSIESKDEAFRLEIQLVSPTLTPEGSADTGIFSGDDESNTAINDKVNDCLDGDLDISSDDDFDDVTNTNCIESSTEIRKDCNGDLLLTVPTVVSEPINTAINDKSNDCLDGDLDVSSDDDFEDVTNTNCTESSTEVRKACIGNLLATTSPVFSKPINEVSSNHSTRSPDISDLALTAVDQSNLNSCSSIPTVSDPPISELHINIHSSPPRQCTPDLSVISFSPVLQSGLTAPKSSRVDDSIHPASLSLDHQGSIKSEKLTEESLYPYPNKFSCSSQSAYSNKEQDSEHDVEFILKEMATVNMISPFPDDSNDSFGLNINGGKQLGMNDLELKMTEVSSAITSPTPHLQDNCPMISNLLMKPTMNDASTDPMKDMSLSLTMKDASTDPIEDLSHKSIMKDASTGPIEDLSHKSIMKDASTGPIEDLLHKSIMKDASTDPIEDPSLVCIGGSTHSVEYPSPKPLCVDASTSPMEDLPLKHDHGEASNSLSKDLAYKPVCIDASTSPRKDVSHNPVYIHASTSPIQDLSSKSFLNDPSGRPVKRLFPKPVYVDSSVSPIKKLMLGVLDYDAKPVNDQQQNSSCESTLCPIKDFVAEPVCSDKDLRKDVALMDACTSPIRNAVRTSSTSPIKDFKESSTGISSITSIDSSATCLRKKSLAGALSNTSDIIQCAVKTCQDASTNTSGLTTDGEHDEKQLNITSVDSLLKNMNWCPSWSGTLPPESEILTFVNSLLVSNMPKGVSPSKKDCIVNELSKVVLRIIQSCPANVAKGDVNHHCNTNGILLKPLQSKISPQLHSVGTQTETWSDPTSVNSCVLRSVLEDNHRKLLSLLQCSQAKDASEDYNVSSSHEQSGSKIMTHQQISNVQMNDLTPPCLEDVTCQSDERKVDVGTNDAQGKHSQSSPKVPLSATEYKKNDSTSHIVSDLKRNNSRTTRRKRLDQASSGPCENKKLISEPKVNTSISEDETYQCNRQVMKSEGHVLRSGRRTSSEHQHAPPVDSAPSSSTKRKSAKNLQSMNVAESKVASRPTVVVSVPKEEAIINVRRSPRMKAGSRNKRCCDSETPTLRSAKCAKFDIGTLNDNIGKETDLLLKTSKSDLHVRNENLTPVPSTTECSAINGDTNHESFVKEKVESGSEQDSQIPMLSDSTLENTLPMSSARIESSFSVCSPSSNNELIIDEGECNDTTSTSGAESRLPERDRDEEVCLSGRGSKSFSSKSVGSSSPSPTCSVVTSKSSKPSQKKSKLQKLRSEVSRIFSSGQSAKSPVTHCPETERKEIPEPRLPSVANIKIASAQSREEKRREERAAVLKRLREKSSVPLAAAASGRIAQLIDPTQSHNLKALPKQFKSGERTLNLTPHPPTSSNRRAPQPSVSPSDRLATLRLNNTRPAPIHGGDDMSTKVSSSKLPDPDAHPSPLTPPVSMITLPSTPKLVLESSSVLSAKSTLIPSSSRPLDIVLQGSSGDDNKVKYPVGPNHKNDLKCTVDLVNTTMKNFLACTRFTPQLLQETINVLGQQKLYWSPLVIARYIVNSVEDDHDTPVTKLSKKAPPLTSNQQQLITLVIQLACQHKSMEHLPQEVLQLIEYRMFRLGHAPEIFRMLWLSRMYAAICRALNLRSRALIFCWDALYAIQALGCAVVVCVLQTWPALLPESISFEKACPNSQVLFHILTTQSADRNVSKIRQSNNPALSNVSVAKTLIKYKIQTGGINSDILASSFVARILSNNGDSLVPALVLLSKRESQIWALNRVVNEHLYPALNRWQEGQLSEGSAEKIIWSLCCILRQLNIKESHKTVEPTFKLLRSLLLQTDKAHAVSPQIEEALVAGIALLSRYNLEFAADAVLQWSPPYASKIGISSRLMQHLKSMVNHSCRNYSWWMARLTATSKASCEE